MGRSPPLLTLVEAPIYNILPQNLNRGGGMGRSPPLLTQVEAPIYIIQYAPTGFEQRERDGRGRLLMSHRRGGKGEKGEGCKKNIQYEKSTVARKLF